MITGEVERHCRLDKSGELLLRKAMLHLNWSARVYHRVLKVARTISQAIQLRRGLRAP
ncbi:hypothetical protein CR152_06510 [Massilia violaceinigra]|uniref:Mg chelatase-related protein C-terminal domain-containing protein n=1 Tax=Massilia violaceinigra TaxID=2045208 RepID=A0A2D2DGR7_9BURK|nr:hypothetical protein CR152_06510 [Massilia violaceinigra]